MRICAVIRDLEVDMVEQDFMNEKRSAAREYEEQKVYLRDQLIHELEEKQRMIVSCKRFQNQIWLLGRPNFSGFSDTLFFVFYLMRES